MTSEEINSAVRRLRSLERESAATEAHELAKSLLNVPPRQNHTADLAQVCILALGLYSSAVAGCDCELACATLQAIVEQRYSQLKSGVADVDVFTPLIDCPEPLQAYLKALSLLPRELVTESLERVRFMLFAAM